jgi:AraC-like DNA-binding protein
LAMSSLPLVRAGVLVPFELFLGQLGLPAWKYLEAERLPPEPQRDVEELVPFLSTLKFGERASRAAGVEDIVLFVGARNLLEVLGDFGKVLLRSVTLNQALHTVMVVVRLHNSAEVIWLERKADRVLLCHDFRVADPEGRRHGDFFTLLRMIDLVRLAAAPGWVADAIYLRPSEFVRRKHYEDLFKTRIGLGAGFCAIEFHASLLAAPLKLRDGAAANEAEKVTELTLSAPSDDLIGSLRQAVSGLLRSGSTDISFVAEVAGMSVRNLQRQLHAAGLSYSQILEESRFDVARGLLRDTDLKLIDVALESGYGEPANFTRAFKRWAGVSPKAFRQNLSERI